MEYNSPVELKDYTKIILETCNYCGSFVINRELKIGKGDFYKYCCEYCLKEDMEVIDYSREMQDIVDKKFDAKLFKKKEEERIKIEKKIYDFNIENNHDLGIKYIYDKIQELRDLVIEYYFFLYNNYDELKIKKSLSEEFELNLDNKDDYIEYFNNEINSICFLLKHNGIFNFDLYLYLCLFYIEILPDGTQKLLDSNYDNFYDFIHYFYLPKFQEVNPPLESINKKTTLCINCHGGNPKNYFLLPSDFKLITYQKIGNSSYESNLDYSLIQENKINPLTSEPMRGLTKKTENIPDEIETEEINGIEYIKPQIPHIWKNEDSNRVYMLNYTINCTFFMDEGFESEIKSDIENIKIYNQGFTMCYDDDIYPSDMENLFNNLLFKKSIKSEKDSLGNDFEVNDQVKIINKYYKYNNLNNFYVHKIEGDNLLLKNKNHNTNYCDCIKDDTTGNYYYKNIKNEENMNMCHTLFKGKIRTNEFLKEKKSDVLKIEPKYFNNSIPDSFYNFSNEDTLEIIDDTIGGFFEKFDKTTPINDFLFKYCFNQSIELRDLVYFFSTYTTINTISLRMCKPTDPKSIEIATNSVNNGHPIRRAHTNENIDGIMTTKKIYMEVDKDIPDYTIKTLDTIPGIVGKIKKNGLISIKKSSKAKKKTTKKKKKPSKMKKKPSKMKKKPSKMKKKPSKMKKKPSKMK